MNKIKNSAPYGVFINTRNPRKTKEIVKVNIKHMYPKIELTPLQALENIKNLFIGSPINPTQQFGIIETALKALEIIKDNLDIIEIIKKGSSQGLIDLPDEEYELLKEILK